MKNKRRVLMEAMERRVMLSITDSNASFGNDGKLANPIPGLTNYSAIAANDGDVLLVGSQVPTTTPIGLVKIADVEPNGTVRWIATINSSEDGAILSVVGAVKLADGGAVILTEDNIGNGSGDLFMNWIDASGSAGASTDISGYGLDAGTYFAAMAPVGNTSVVVALETDYGHNFMVETRGSDGSLLHTFAGDAFITDTGVNGIGSIGVQSSGKVIVAGDAALRQNDASHVAIERFNTDGSLDTTFGTNGKYIAVFPFDATHMLIRPDDEILLLTGYEGLAFTANGQIDPSFGQAVAQVTLAGLGDMRAVQFASDGSIFAAGFSGNLPEVVQLSSGGFVQTGSFGSAEFAAGSAFISVTPSGQVVTLLPGGVLEEAVGLSVSQTPGAGNPPSAHLGRLRRIPAGATTYEFDVTYVDTQSGIDTSTIQSGTVLIRYGRQKYLYGTLVSNKTYGPENDVATYEFTAPNGAWLSDPGTYTIETASDEVTDNAGNGVPLQVLGSFTIKPTKTPKPAAAALLTNTPILMADDATPTWLNSNGEVL